MCKTASLNASVNFWRRHFFRGILSSLSAPRDFFGGIFCKTVSERYSVLSALQDWQTKTQRKPDMLGNIIIVLSSRSPPSNVLSRFETLGEQVAAVPGVGEAIIDGEVIVADETGRPQFYDLVRRIRAPAYVAFDIPWLDGTDLRCLALAERRRRLQGILPKGSPIVSEALAVAGRGRELFELMREHDLEGIVAKRMADPYDPRVRWLKIKNPDYSQKEGRGDSFNEPRHRSAHSVG